jgi:type III secretion protein C
MKLIFLFLTFTLLAYSEPGYTIHFNEVSMSEFIRFISRISKKSFIYDDAELDFKVSVSSGSELQPPELIVLLLNVAQQHGCRVREQNGCYVISKPQTDKGTGYSRSKFPASIDGDYTLYKLQYHLGSEIISALKGADFSSSPEVQKAIQALQWIETTNAILLSGKAEAVKRLLGIIQNLDQQQKQVFIEVLVIETNVKNGLDFGLEWAAGGDIKNKIGFAAGTAEHNLAKSFQSINATNKPSGPDQIPMNKGFDMGIIGDLIFHRGRSFLSLASLIHALQVDGDSKIILNQKIVAQDGKSSSVFVGDNIPFPGTRVETLGMSQQTTANIDYRDIGVSLKITPFLGSDNVITLDISEEITEATHDISQTGGITTTKTNMLTKVHVPDQCFVVLSGMSKNKKVKRKEGIPCLGSLPLIGSLFSRTRTEDEKRNVIIFVRPRLLHNHEDMKDIADEHHLSPT